MISTILNSTASQALNVPGRTRGGLLDRPEAPGNLANSFAAQLASVLEGYLGTGSPSGHLEFSIDAQPGQDSGTRQFVVTLKNSSPAPAPLVAPAATAAAATAPPAAEKPAYATAADAYWAMHPPEVQTLRNIPDLEGRNAKAAELMSKGFTIDSDIMVWGYDPYAAMLNRMGGGYTWVPAAGQPDVPLGPGLSFPGRPSYDPLHPPAGSIIVSLDFAKGLEHTSPAWHPDIPS